MKNKRKKCYWGDKCKDNCKHCSYYQPLDENDKINDYINALKEREEVYKEYVDEIND